MRRELLGAYDRISGSTNCAAKTRFRAKVPAGGVVMSMVAGQIDPVAVCPLPSMKPCLSC